MLCFRCALDFLTLCVCVCVCVCYWSLGHLFPYSRHGCHIHLQARVPLTFHNIWYNARAASHMFCLSLFAVRGSRCRNRTPFQPPASQSWLWSRFLERRVGARVMASYSLAVVCIAHKHGLVQARGLRRTAVLPGLLGPRPCLRKGERGHGMGSRPRVNFGSPRTFVLPMVRPLWCNASGRGPPCHGMGKPTYCSQV